MAGEVKSEEDGMMIKGDLIPAAVVGGDEVLQRPFEICKTLKIHRQSTKHRKTYCQFRCYAAS